jgi:hypothetical protein
MPTQTALPLGLRPRLGTIEAASKMAVCPPCRTGGGQAGPLIDSGQVTQKPLWTCTTGTGGIVSSVIGGAGGLVKWVMQVGYKTGRRWCNGRATG